MGMVQDGKFTNRQPKDSAGIREQGQFMSRFEEVKGGAGRRSILGGREEIWA